jgi:hypothetical protein
MRANLVDTSLRVLIWCCVILRGILSLLPDHRWYEPGSPIPYLTDRLKPWPYRHEDGERGTSSLYRFAASALISSRSDVTGRYDDGMFSDGSNALEDTNK